MNDSDNFDVSQLRWWRCVAVDTEDKIQTFTAEIDSDHVYAEFFKIREGLQQKGWRFIEAKPIPEEEILATAKLLQFKARKRERNRGLIGRRYSPLSHWPIALFVVLLILLILWLVCRHLGT
jgi:hypothetical protein